MSLWWFGLSGTVFLSSTRVNFAAAFDRKLPEGISYVEPSTRTPVTALLLMAIPGMVLGLAYIFTFNNPSSPLNFLYGTMSFLVISTLVQYYTVPFLTALISLKKIEPEIETMSESMNAPFHRTFMRVIVPVSLPAIICVASYLFLNAMVTLSLVLFLFVPGNELGALSVLLLDHAAETAQAMRFPF